MKKLPWITLTIAIACIAIHLLQLDASLQWTRGDGFSLTRCWTLASSHLTHWSTSHLFWNMLMFTTLGWLVERRNSAAMIRTLLFCVMLIIPVVAVTMPQVSAYRGLSGVASALYVMLACMLWRQHPAALMRPMAILAIGALLGKCALELINETAAFSQWSQAIAVCPQAHLAGALAGVLGDRFRLGRKAIHECIVIPAS